MKSNDQELQIEVTLAQTKGRKGNTHRIRDVPKATDPPCVPRISRLMALAIKFQDLVDRGEVRDYADLARLGYVTRARLTQIMNLLLLAPDIQEELLMSQVESGIPEHRLRLAVREVNWSTQRVLLSELLHGGTKATMISARGRNLILPISTGAAATSG